VLNFYQGLEEPRKNVNYLIFEGISTRMSEGQKEGHLVASRTDETPLQKEEQSGEGKPVRRRAVARLKEEVEILKGEVARLQGEMEQTKDRWMRAVAELENYKKRSAREMEESCRYGNERLLKEVLPILDSMERALAHAQNAENGETFLEGIQMIHRQFLSILERFGVRSVNALNEPFDPSRHEAMIQVESSAHAPNTVVQELEKGYLIHDRLLRPAKVAVSKRSEG
jgi:molecular chaperone GrpE